MAEELGGCGGAGETATRSELLENNLRSQAVKTICHVLVL